MDSSYPTILSIENPETFSCVVKSLFFQSKGDEGDFILSENEKEYSIAKNVEVIINPWSVETNSKKILTKLYLEAEEIGNGYYSEKIQKINADIIELLEKISEKLSYPTDYNLDLDMQSVLKQYKLIISENEYNNLSEKLIDYIKLVRRVENKEWFVFVNLLDYLTELELSFFLESCLYEQISLFCIEGHYRKIFQKHYGIIIDNDLCVIKLN